MKVTNIFYGPAEAGHYSVRLEPDTPARSCRARQCFVTLEFFVAFVVETHAQTH